MTWQSEKGWGQLEIGKNRQIYSQGSSALSAEGKGTFEARSKKLKVKHSTWMRKKKSREIKTRGKQNQSTQWRNKKDSRSKLSNKKGVKTSVKQSIYICTMEWQKLEKGMWRRRIQRRKHIIFKEVDWRRLFLLIEKALFAVRFYLKYNLAFSTFCFIFLCSTQKKKKRGRGGKELFSFNQNTKTWKASSANIMSHTTSVAYSEARYWMSPFWESFLYG